MNILYKIHFLVFNIVKYYGDILMDTQKITETNEEQKDDGYLILKEAEDIIKHNSNRSKWQKFLLFFLLFEALVCLVLCFGFTFTLSKKLSCLVFSFSLLLL